MENFIKFLILTVNLKTEGISLNLDILETGLINIILLIGILIYSVKDPFIELLEERKTVIVNSITEAEERLNEATRRLDEAKKQLNQSEIVLGEIKNDKIKTKKILLESDADAYRNELLAKFDRASATLETRRAQALIEVKEEIIILALKRGMEAVGQDMLTKRTEKAFFKRILTHLIKGESL